MGLYPSGEIIYGIPVERSDPETYEDSYLWVEDEEEEGGDWRELPGELTVRTYGHYDDPDGPRGFLTLSSFQTFSADAWEPKALSVRHLDMDEQNTYNEALCAAIDAAGLWEHLPEPHRPTWYLVASYG